MQINRPICMTCKNFTPDANEDGMFFCKAFPNIEPWTKAELKKREDDGITLDPKGIPDEVISGDNNHSKKITGQTGDFIFEEGIPE